MASIYDAPIESDVESFQNTYIMVPELWGRFKFDDLKEVDFSKWNSVKLINKEGTAFSEMVNQIPDNSGGIYVYSIEPGIIPNCGTYIMYIGMASKSKNQNLRRRVKAYQLQLGDRYNRDRLHRLFKKWGQYVYVHFLPIQADEKIILEVETRLIAAFIPPCNADIRARTVKKAVKAFR